MSYTFPQYSADALRTAGTKNDDGTLNIRESFLNGALGLSGESNELLAEVMKMVYEAKYVTREVFSKEMGDCLWYANLVACAADVGLEGTVGRYHTPGHVHFFSTYRRITRDRLDKEDSYKLLKAMQKEAEKACVAAGKVNEVLKKHIYHGRELIQEELIAHLHAFIDHLFRLAEILDIDMAQVGQGNIEKLRKRHPEKFDGDYDSKVV